ncbi:LCP family protein [Limosilactobacillus sp. STM2_1]|uniref:LCP family protein n=1 Tax=Limosilactobacillus rudii TaxID=2759755 RepID=A0A7W3UN30_9LACO|nr:LCP family protein [Limosilactobacillus rudii]MBB1079992.1 LCP family protein [Limosilactobacillus rudii]MBB1098125.1 LCP family protein [Limosilactobacillus rudii]MCD7135195.1 LCP family protein [Limosilactobacillus rudii]
MKIRNHWLWYLLASVAALILVTLGYAYKSWHTTTSSIMTNTSSASAQKVKDGRPFSVLIMGTDVGALGRGTSYAGNTDTMELITVNPSKKKMTMIAIPRDTLVKVDTKKGADYVKINAAYAIGGAKQAKKQVSELLGVPVDYYALMNMGTLEKVVNAVGGVEVNNPFAFTYEGHHFKKGYQHLDGKTALKYSRMRYDDPDNDYGRQRRGQQVIQSAVDSFKKKGSVAAANKIMTAVQDGVRTDVPVNDIASLYLNYHQAMQKTDKVQFRGKNAMIEGTSFQIATPSEIDRVSKITRQSLDLPVKDKINNNETAMYNLQTNWNGINNLNFVLPHHAKYNQPGSGY